MTTTSTLTAARTSDSSDRTPIMTAARPAGQRKTVAARVGGAAKRFLNNFFSNLMRSLATPHI